MVLYRMVHASVYTDTIENPSFYTYAGIIIIRLCLAIIDLTSRLYRGMHALSGVRRGGEPI